MTWKDFFKGILSGLIIGLMLALLIHSRLKQDYELRIAEHEAYIQRANDSIAQKIAENEALQIGIDKQKQNTDSLMGRISYLEKNQQQAETDVLLLTPNESTKFFDSRTANPKETVLRGDTALTSLEAIREANRLFVVLDYTLQASTLKTAVIASQDSTIKKLEAVNKNQGIIIDQKDLIIEKKDGIIESYEGIIADCQRRKKIEAFARWVLIGGIWVALLF